MYYDLKIGKVEGIRDLVDKTEREILYSQQEPEQELELCNTYEEYVQWRIEKNLEPGAAKPLKLSDIGRRKRYV